MIIVTVRKLRPDFRVFIDLLYAPDQDVDSDGDARDVWDRGWHDLYLSARTPNAASIDLCAKDASPHLFEVNSESQRLEELAGLYLYLYCGERIERDGAPLTDAEVTDLTEKYSEELERAKGSIWHKSHKGHPYPNKLGPNQPGPN